MHEFSLYCECDDCHRKVRTTLFDYIETKRISACEGWDEVDFTQEKEDN